MSWEAVRWAMEQDPGDPMLKWVLIGTCNFVNKRSGKTYVTPKTVAEFCNIKRPQSVADWQKKLRAMRFLRDTGERGGGNGRVISWAPGWDKKLTTPRVASSQQTNNELTTDFKQTNNNLVTPSVASFIGKVGTNPESGTHKVSSENSPIYISRPPDRPDEEEFFVYFIEEYIKTGQLEDEDADYFWEMKEANGWPPKEKWKHVLGAWKAAGYFPSQKKKMKGKR
jgi:hypothetical protein